ncbi:MAG: hypothetical protein JXB13_17680 [Phycisphaerae bacterium]|nr:hypothetical protein [Phycisphaerae bacterium]
MGCFRREASVHRRIAALRLLLADAVIMDLDGTTGKAGAKLKHKRTLRLSHPGMPTAG